MKKLLLLLILITVNSNVFSQRTGAIDTIWGKVVEDKYRWLEDLDSKETQDWLKVQDSIRIANSPKIFKTVNEKLKFYSRVKSEWTYRDYIEDEDLYYFKFYRDRFGPTPSLYYIKKGFFSQNRFLFNPFELDRSSLIDIDYIKISPDNRLLAMLLSKNGSDYSTLRFIDMKTEKLLVDSVEYIKYSNIVWHNDGIFYSKFDVNDLKQSFKTIIKGQKIYYHKLGTNQSEDKLIYQPDNELALLYFKVSEDNKYLVLSTQNDLTTSYSITDLNDISKINFKVFIVTKKKDLFFNVIGMNNEKLFVHSNLNAPNGAVYIYNSNELNQGEVFIKQTEDNLDFVKIIGNKFVCGYHSLTKSYGQIVDSLGMNVYRWEIEEGCEFSRISKGRNDNEVIYSFNSFYVPSSYYKLDLVNFNNTSISKAYINYEYSKFITKKVFYYSKDSTVIPMYITLRKDIKLNGQNPVLLYGYGGYGVSTKPDFDRSKILFIEKGGILATPCLRGGGDFPGWHEKGMRLNKQNTIDDFIAAAEYLIKENITVPSKIAAMGNGHGGFVVGASMVKRPDLFKVVVSDAGFLDMLRYHLFNVGYLFKDEFGDITDQNDFNNLISYSPCHNINEGINYPAILLVASDNDDQVLPFHSFKFLASLQEKGTKENPAVLYFHKRAGHSGNDNYEEYMQENAFKYSFIFKHLGIEKKL